LALDAVTSYRGVAVKGGRLECVGRDGKKRVLVFRLDGDELRLYENNAPIVYRRKR
jgi:hypothetical protein